MWLLYTVLLVGSVVHAFFLDNTCDLEGWVDNRNKTGIQVPNGCKNGSFWWNYPRGHVVLHFSNPLEAETEICFFDGLLGNVLTITDVTDGANYTVAPSDSKTSNESCSDPTTATDITMRIDAPKMQLYVAGINYKVNRQ